MLAEPAGDVPDVLDFLTGETDVSEYLLVGVEHRFGGHLEALEQSLANRPGGLR